MGKKMLLAVFAALLLSGCKTKYVAVPEYHTRDSIVLRLQRDSVCFRDSVFVNQWTEGDTVYRDRVKTTYLYKDRLRTDTVVVNKTDSVTIVQEIERPLKWYDLACRYAAIGLLIALVIVGAWRRKS